MSTIIYCTPHNVVLVNPEITKFDSKTKIYFIDKEKVHDLIVSEADENSFEIFYPSGIIPRCTQSETPIGIVTSSKTEHEFNIYKMEYGVVENLPEPKEDTYYIVSALVANAAKDRSDLLIPTHMVRNEAGQPIGCLDFSKV